MRRHPRITFSQTKRKRIFKRDNYRCQLCDKDLKDLPEERVIDHRIPLSKGGNNLDTNLWLACSTCDQQKKDDILPFVVAERIDQLKKKHPHLR